MDTMVIIPVTLTIITIILRVLINIIVVARLLVFIFVYDNNNDHPGNNNKIISNIRMVCFPVVVGSIVIYVPTQIYVPTHAIARHGMARHSMSWHAMPWHGMAPCPLPPSAWQMSCSGALGTELLQQTK